MYYRSCPVFLQDPACCSYSQALLYFKGFHAIQCHRIAHCLWHAGRRILATALQSRVSEVFAVDIHPAAKLGRGVLLDHGTGVVIGETAEVGNNVSILQNVTLGGTGKEHGDRHPKVSDNVLIGASATILGNIRIGKGAQVAAGSLVLKPVPPRTMVAGSPAKEVGTVSGNPALKMEQWTEKSKEELCEELFTPAGKTSAAVATGIEAAKPGQERRTEDKVASPGEISEKATGKVDSAKAVKTRDGAPPVFEGSVDAVTTDKEAKKKWGSRKPSSDMEYFI